MKIKHVINYKKKEAVFGSLPEEEMENGQVEDSIVTIYKKYEE